MRILKSAFLIWVGSGVWALAQSVGDQPAIGYGANRSFLQGHAGRFQPPFQKVATIPLAGDSTGAGLTLAFEDLVGQEVRHFLLVAETGNPVVLGVPTSVQGAPPPKPLQFHLFDRGSGQKLWTHELREGGQVVDFSPAYSGGILLLGGNGVIEDGVIHAVSLPDGEILWEDAPPGQKLDGRHPVLENDVAFYAFEDHVFARQATTGDLLWKIDVPTAQAALSLAGGQLYFSGLTTVHAVDRTTGRGLWVAEGLGGNRAVIAASAGRVFVNRPETGEFAALDARDGREIWKGVFDADFASPGLAVAYNRIYLFGTRLIFDGNEKLIGSEIVIRALDASTGALLWETTDKQPSAFVPQGVFVTPPQHTFVANNAIYYFDLRQFRLKVRDAFDGSLIWSRRIVDLAGLSLAGENLFMLFKDRVEVHRSLETVYFAHFASGGGPGRNQNTLLLLSNLSDGPAEVTVTFTGNEGEPADLRVVGFEGSGATFELVIGPRASAKLETFGTGPLQSGWIEVASTQALRGSSVFRLMQPMGTSIIAHEAGVEDSPPTGRAATFVERVVGGLLAVDGNTGLAIANPGDETANVTLTLLDRDQQTVGELALVLEGRNQVARFLDDFFPELPLGPEPFDAPREFTGSLLIDSDLPMLSTAVRTLDGLQTSSVPVGRVRR